MSNPTLVHLGYKWSINGYHIESIEIVGGVATVHTNRTLIVDGKSVNRSFQYDVSEEDFVQEVAYLKQQLTKTDQSHLYAIASVVDQHALFFFNGDLQAAEQLTDFNAVKLHLVDSNEKEYDRIFNFKTNVMINRDYLNVDANEYTDASHAAACLDFVHVENERQRSINYRNPSYTTNTILLAEKSNDE